MFRATQCSSSGESIVSIHHLVYITFCTWLSGMPGCYASLESAPGSWREPTAPMIYLEKREIPFPYREIRRPKPRSLTTSPGLTYQHTRTSLIRTLLIRISNYPNRLGFSGKFFENFTKLTCLEMTGYGIKYSTVLWFLELQIRRVREV
jgi:hypothetical protein